MSDPRSRIIAVVLVGLLSISLEGLGALAMLTLICMAPLLVAPIGWPWRRRALAGVAALLWSTTFSQAIFYAEEPRTVAAQLGPLTFWNEGIKHGLVQSLRLVSVTCAGLALAATTPLDRLLTALLKLRVPFPLAFLSVMALRFLPEVAREVLVVRRARARRGRPTWRRSPADWIRLELALLRPIVARSLRRARTLAESLELRGFDATSPRAVHRPLHMGKGEFVVLAIATFGCFSVAAARLLYVAYLQELAYFPELRSLYGFIRDWL